MKSAQRAEYKYGTVVVEFWCTAPAMPAGPPRVHAARCRTNRTRRRRALARRPWPLRSHAAAAAGDPSGAPFGRVDDVRGAARARLASAPRPGHRAEQIARYLLLQPLSSRAPAVRSIEGRAVRSVRAAARRSLMLHARQLTTSDRAAVARFRRPGRGLAHVRSC